MKKSSITVGRLMVLLSVILPASCTNDDLVPLRDPQQTEEEIAIDWAATADSMQDATYGTYLGSEGVFVQDNTGNSTFHYWPNAHVLHVLVDAYLRTDDGAYLDRMKSLVRGIEIRNGGSYQNVFNDDMLWLGNSSMRAYNATGDDEYLEVAEYLWDEIRLSWSDEVLGGGITWKKNTPFQKNAVSNGPAVILGTRLYEATQNPEDLEWAKKIYEWQKNNLVDPVTGLVWDGVSLENGEAVVNKDWIFTYNAGTWIGAGLKLYNITGEEQYLNDALKTARSLMTSSELTTEGVLKSEGQGDGGLFKGILVRYFTQLILEPDIPESDREDFVDFMEFNAETFYENSLSRPGMLAGPDWRNAPESRTDLTTQLSGLMLMEAAALLDEQGYFEQ
ncbi:glycoside hydrolase family 76 protein [Salinimicrobium sp. GXAS 041]|uniref:glycoside hydrolase family 76 protein n=1 Tax=Salinimicrobium sp. GXAS 041 TaxID=3400806 RepID=UPI003C746BA6